MNRSGALGRTLYNNQVSRSVTLYFLFADWISFPPIGGFDSSFGSPVVQSGRIGLSGQFESVVTWLAGFAGDRRPQLPGGRTPIPAAFRYLPAVSRRTPVA